jgi:hypothetical protein
MAILQYKKIVSAKRLLATISICLVVLFLITVPAKARRAPKAPTTLTIHPAEAGELEKKYELTIKAEDQIDGDALPLYEKAVTLIPKDFNQDQIREWLELPVEQFPQQQAEEVLQKYLEPLKLAARAARCKECNWPQWKPGDQPENLAEYRKLAFIIELWARLEISRGGYEGAAIAIRTGFGTAGHLGQGPTIIQGLVGAAIGGLMCREVEKFVQSEGSPNLYRALGDMPRPFVDIEKSIENEKKAAQDSALNKLSKGQVAKQLAQTFDKVRLISKRLDNNLNGLQCVEAIRHYAATHDGQLPQSLDDIKDLEIPKDLISGNAFEYRRTATGATLRSAIPKAGNERDAVRYDIVLKKQPDIRR